MSFAALRTANAQEAPARPGATAVDRYRPHLHYTPPSGFMNDPNGLLFADGEWHLFFQHNPAEPVMGNVHWGHATSRDLMRWETLSLALDNTQAGEAFSGSAVLDSSNTSGLFEGGAGGIVAIYTRARPDLQTQVIAFSRDGGRSFADYDGNPVLDVGSNQFRDPKVLWHAETRRWIMSVVRAREHRVMFYASPDLRTWSEVGEFARAGILGVDYECPDLVRVPVEGGGERWVLFVSVNPGGPQGGSAVQYFVGALDGSSFTPDDHVTRILDMGKDFYAFQTFSNVEGAPVGLAWMSNWQYANETPTGDWRGAMTVARRLSLRRQGKDWRLVQRPVGLDALAWQALVENEARESVALPQGAALDLRCTFDLSGGERTSLRLANGAGEYVEIGADPGPAVGSLWIDRHTNGFRQRFFTDKFSSALEPGATSLPLHLVFDRCSLEAFAGDGATAASLLHFFAEFPDRLEVRTSGGLALPPLSVRSFGA